MASEADAEAAAEFVQALVVARETGIRDMIHVDRDFVLQRDAIAEFEGLAKQHMTAERLAVRSRRPDPSVVETRPEKDAEREPVLRHQQIARQQPGPGRAEIGLV